MIDFERWDEVKEIVQAALDMPAERQAAYLDEACAGDHELRKQVDMLLAVSSTRADFYDDFQVLPPGFQTVTFKEGDEIGPYRIARPIGTGGMSTVYLADDPRHERQVAIKVLTRKPRRPRHEERTVARFRHSNIVALHDSGQIEGGPPYFVMEYIEGETITTYCEERKLSVEERLRLFLSVCDAVAYAHRHLVIHRDLKPANILVTMDGVPKLLDFGIAKNVRPFSADETATAPEDRALTVAFASPEQLDAEETSTATDIYSLGVLLCLLLTGRLPYPVKSYHDLPWAIRNMEPEKPSQIVLRRPELAEDSPDQASTEAASGDGARKLARSLSGDLDAIVLKALRKEPDRRYSTVAELAADVGHYLQSEPVTARKGSRRYRAGKFIQRHRPMVVLSAVAALIVVCLLIVLAVQLRETARQRDAATLAAARSNQLSTFLVSIFDLGDPFRDLSTPPTVSDLLSQSVAQLRSGKLGSTEDKVLFQETIGRIYSAQGSYREALLLYNDALTGVHDTPVDQARILTAIAATHIDLGEFPAAREALRRTRNLHESNSFAPQTDVAQRLLISGRERALSGAFIDSLPYLRNALGIASRIPNQEKMVAAIYEELSQSLANLSRFEEALSSIDKALEIERQIYQDKHPAIARTLMNRAKILRAFGRYSEAEADLQQAETVLAVSLGPNHPAITDIFEERGALAIEQQKFDHAEVMFGRTFKLRMQMLGAAHPLTLSAYQHLGEAIQGRGDLPRAELMLRKALADNERFGGEKRHWVICSITSASYFLSAAISRRVASSLKDHWL